MDNQPDLDIKYEHYRIPHFSIQGKIGVSFENDLTPYSRKLGFILKDLYLAELIRGIMPNPRGGKTVCTITWNGKTFVGEAVCSKKDVFNYKRGRDIARGRAFKSMYGD